MSAPQGTYVRGRDGRWKRVGVAARAARDGEAAGRRVTASRSEARLGVGADGQLRQDKHLPAIAAMLDEKQFDAHRARDARASWPSRAAPGSGKTTVGLHRVAYLAFAEPQRFRPDKMLVVVPNEALIHYVSRVLPSLGVEGVPVTTFARFAARLAAQMFPRLPTKASDETPPVVSRAKSHAAMLRGIERLVARVDGDGGPRGSAPAMEKWPEGARVVAAAGRRRRREDDAAAGRARVDAGGVAGGQAAAARACASADRAAGGHAGARSSSSARSCGTRRARWLGLWDELLTSREALAETFDGVPGFGPGQLDQVHAWCVRQARMRAEGERDGEEPRVDAEDRALLLRCWQALRGPHRGRRRQAASASPTSSSTRCRTPARSSCACCSSSRARSAASRWRATSRSGCSTRATTGASSTGTRCSTAWACRTRRSSR